MASMLPAAHRLDGRFDVTGRSLSGVARFDARLDKAADIVEMKDDRRVKIVGKGLALTNDVVAALQIERARGVREQLRVADDYGNANVAWTSSSATALRTTSGPMPAGSPMVMPMRGFDSPLSTA